MKNDSIFTKGGTMSIVSRQGLFKVAFISLVLVFGLGVFPSTTQAITLGELLGGEEIKIGNLRFFNFKLIGRNSFPPDKPLIKPEMITVVPFAEEQTGLRFEANGELTVTAPAGGPFALVNARFSYDVETIDGSHSIKTNSQVLVSSSIDKGSGNMSIREAVRNENSLELGAKSIFFNKIPDGTEIKQPSVALDYSSQPVAFASLEVLITVQALPDSVFGEGVASIDVFEQSFSLVSLADAGPDQLVSGDTVTLDASGSKVAGTHYIWDFFLKNEESSVPLKSADTKEEIVEVEVADLKPDIYLVRLTLTDGAGVEQSDTAIIAISGPCEAEAPEPNAGIHWLNFKLKQYKYCNWAFARMYGAVDLPEKLHNLPHGKILNGSVTIIVEDALEGEKPLVISTPTRMKVRNRSRYKTVLRTYYR